MAIVNGYCTDDQLRAQLGDGGSKLSATLIDAAVEAASRAIDRHCGRRFWKDTGLATRTYSPLSPTYCFVDDIATKTGLVVSVGSDGVTFPTTLAIDTDYILEPRNAEKFATSDFDAFAYWQIRLIGSQFVVDSTRSTLSVTATHGWSAVPPEVTQACILKATALFKRKDAPFGVAGFSEFGAVRIQQTDLDVIDMLSKYQLPGFA